MSFLPQVEIEYANGMNNVVSDIGSIGRNETNDFFPDLLVLSLPLLQRSFWSAIGLHPVFEVGHGRLAAATGLDPRTDY